jgi:glutamate decarboxylase
MFEKVNEKKINKKNSLITPIYARDALKKPIPKYELAKDGMRAKTAYSIIHDELILDGNSRLNLATFVSTYMEDEAKQLIMDTLDKNMIDKDEYPKTAEIEKRCVNILANLWNASSKEIAMGCSTIGSSEACMLGALAMKHTWREKRKKENKDFSKPNLIMGMNVQVCWEKFCRYFDVEPKFVMCEGDRFTIDPKEAAKLCDENTIGVVCILGSTFDGSYEPVEEMSKELDKLKEEKNLDIPIHVDGASGAFIAPFLDPKLKWDFRVQRVVSINTSGHKYGLVYPGVGWVVFRDKEYLPEDLIFYVDYLGGKMPTFAINFSRPGAQICAQYYNFLRYGFEGYREIQQTCRDVALFLSSEIEKLGPFKLITKGDDIPVFAWTLKKDTNYTLYDLAEKLRENGWLVPAYKMPKNRDDLTVQRIVVKNGFSFDMANLLLNDIKRHLDFFAKQTNYVKKEEGSQFKH